MSLSYESALVPYFCLETYIKQKRLLSKPEEQASQEQVEKITTLFAAVSITLKQGDVIAEAFQAEVVFSSSVDPKPIIASYGAGPCVIVGGYDKVHQVGFVAHFSCSGEVLAGGIKIIKKLKALIPEDRTGQFDLVLKGGIKTEEVSEKTLATISHWVGMTNELSRKCSFQVRSVESLASPREDSKSLAIDTRTGAMRDYDPLRDNPIHYRRLNQEDIKWAQRSFEVEPKLKVVYPEYCF